jgi:hypothetical protein
MDIPFQVNVDTLVKLTFWKTMISCSGRKHKNSKCIAKISSNVDLCYEI